MPGQAERCGRASLTRAAEIMSDGLDQMRGATSPRLLLELMCAQVLLPAASTDERSLLARLELLEAGASAVAASVPVAPGAGNDYPERQRPTPSTPQPSAEGGTAPAAGQPVPPAPPAQQPGPARPARPAGETQATPPGAPQ